MFKKFKIKTGKEPILESKAGYGTSAKKAYAAMPAQDVDTNVLMHLPTFHDNIAFAAISKKSCFGIVGSNNSCQTSSNSKIYERC